MWHLVREFSRQITYLLLFTTNWFLSPRPDFWITTKRYLANEGQFFLVKTGFFKENSTKNDVYWGVSQQGSTLFTTDWLSYYDVLIVLLRQIDCLYWHLSPLPWQVYVLTLTSLWPIPDNSMTYSDRLPQFFLMKVLKKRKKPLFGCKLCKFYQNFSSNTPPDTAMTYALTSVWPITDKLMTFRSNTSRRNIWHTPLSH